MKRISFLLVLLALTPGITEAYYYSSCYYSVRYSPYAFNYRNSGLVYGVDYTPYAFNYRNSGLVPGYGLYGGSYSSDAYPAFGGHFKRASRPAFHGSRPMRRWAQDAPTTVRPMDGMEIIRRHLANKGFTAMNIDRILRIDDQLVSVDFLIKDRNLLIKYWNPRGIESLGEKENFKQKAYEKYQRDWTRVAAQHEQNGGTVYSVEASDAQTIVASLDACTNLDAGPETPVRPVMYARN